MLFERLFESLRWVRDHPIFTTSVAAAGAALSLPHSLKANSQTSLSKEKAISWGDDHGGPLVHFIEETKHEPTMLTPKCLKTPDYEDDLINSTKKGGEESPSWGWFVTFTPPQNPMFGTHPTLSQRT